MPGEGTAHGGAGKFACRPKRSAAGTFPVAFWVSSGPTRPGDGGRDAKPGRKDCGHRQGRGRAGDYPLLPCIAGRHRGTEPDPALTIAFMLVLNSPASRKKSACLSAAIVGHGLQDTEQAFSAKAVHPACAASQGARAAGTRGLNHGQSRPAFPAMAPVRTSRRTWALLYERITFSEFRCASSRARMAASTSAVVAPSMRSSSRRLLRS